MDILTERLSFWDKLSDEEQQLVSTSVIIRSFEAQEPIHSCNKQCVGMVYVLSGDMRLFLLSDEGKEVTLLHISGNESCVLAASCVMSQITFHSELVAAEKTELLIIPAPVLAKLMKTNIYVRCYVYETSAKLFSDVMWTMQQTLFYSVDRRLASFLITEYEKAESPELCVTQETIAQEINSAREVVARMLKKFAADNLLKNQRGKIVLLDIDRLYDMSC